MKKYSLKEMLRSLPTDERRKLLPGLTDEKFEQLLRLSDREIAALVRSNMPVREKTTGKNVPSPKTAWFDEPLCGLSEDGKRHLNELCTALETPGSGHQVDRKQLRYLKQLKKMRLSVPACFRKKAEPKKLYHHLRDFCLNNDIPQEIVQRVVPALITYIETGHMRPIIFVGEKGCGKTTAVKLLVEEALHLPTEVIKIPQLDGSHGMTGDCGTYRSADVGCIAKARLRANSLLVAYVFDEIDKATHGSNRASVDDELLSITDESCSDVYDNYLETTLPGLEYCPMFMTANDLQKISPILVDRCTVIAFPNATASRLKSISKKYVDKKLKNDPIYRLIRFDYALLDAQIDELIRYDITSIRKYQQMVEAVLEKALTVALTQESEEAVSVSAEMFATAANAVLGVEKRRVGFA